MEIIKESAEYSNALTELANRISRREFPPRDLQGSHHSEFGISSRILERCAKFIFELYSGSETVKEYLRSDDVIPRKIRENAGEVIQICEQLTPLLRRWAQANPEGFPFDEVGSDVKILHARIGDVAQNLIASAIALQGTLEQVISAFNGTEHEIAQEAALRVDAAEKRLGNISEELGALKNANAQSGFSPIAEEFGQLADESKTRFWIGIAVFVLAVASMTITHILFGEPKLSSPMRGLYELAFRASVVSLEIYVALQGVRISMSGLHLQTIFRFRQVALSNFQKIANGAVGAEDVRQQILSESAKAVYSSIDTGLYPTASDQVTPSQVIKNVLNKEETK